MIHKRNILFFMMMSIMHSCGVFASQDGPSAASSSSNVQEIAKTSLVVGAIVAIPCAGLYGMKKFFEWWNLSYAIKSDTEAIIRTQREHGEVLAQHGEVLRDVRRDQIAQSKQLSEIGGTLERHDDHWSATRVWQEAQESLLTKVDATTNAVKSAVGELSTRLAAVDGRVTVLQTDMAKVKAGMTAVHAAVNAQANAQARMASEVKEGFEQTGNRLTQMEGRIVKAVEKNGVPAAAARLGANFNAALISRSALSQAKPHTGGAAVRPTVTAEGLSSLALFQN